MPPRATPRPSCSTGRRPGRRHSRRATPPPPFRSASSISPRCSIVRYEMQRRASSTYGRDERARGARVEAGGARAAAIRQRVVEDERGRGQHDPDEEQRAELRREQVRVLADPAEPGARGEIALEHRARVDGHARRLRSRRRRAGTRRASRAARGSRRGSRGRARTRPRRATTDRRRRLVAERDRDDAARRPGKSLAGSSRSSRPRAR